MNMQKKYTFYNLLGSEEKEYSHKKYKLLQASGVGLCDFTKETKFNCSESTLTAVTTQIQKEDCKWLV